MDCLRLITAEMYIAVVIISVSFTLSLTTGPVSYSCFIIPQALITLIVILMIIFGPKEPHPSGSSVTEAISRLDVSDNNNAYFAKPRNLLNEDNVLDPLIEKLRLVVVSQS